MDLVTLRATPCDCTRCDDDEEQLRFHEAEDAEHAMMLYLIVCFDALQVEADIIVVLLVYYATFFFNVERFPIQWLRLQLAIIEIERLANDLEVISAVEQSEVRLQLIAAIRCRFLIVFVFFVHVKFVIGVIFVTILHNRLVKWVVILRFGRVLHAIFEFFELFLQSQAVVGHLRQAHSLCPLDLPFLLLLFLLAVLLCLRLLSTLCLVADEAEDSADARQRLCLLLIGLVG